jgi:hypothetical protein
MEYLCNTNVVIDKNIILNIENICYDKFKEKWYNNLMLNVHSKLRTYRLFKNEYCKENYLLKNIPGKYISAYGKFRCGVAPLKIETGRYEGILTENRLIFNNICHINNCIEDENHVLLYCPVYEDLRQYLFNHVFIIIILCICLMLINLYFHLIIRICFFYTAKICYEILMRRKHFISIILHMCMLLFIFYR